MRTIREMLLIHHASMPGKVQNLRAHFLAGREGVILTAVDRGIEVSVPAVAPGEPQIVNLVPWANISYIGYEEVETPAVAKPKAEARTVA